jgi:membrane protein implicated in regulation of membrane protease activity
MAIPIVALAWLYVVLMMSVAEATSSNGTVLGAVFTFLLYGALPLSLVLYILGTPARRRARRAAESGPPAQGEHAAGEAVAPERKEP